MRGEEDDGGGVPGKGSVGQGEGVDNELVEAKVVAQVQAQLEPLVLFSSTHHVPKYSEKLEEKNSRGDRRGRRGFILADLSVLDGRKAADLKAALQVERQQGCLAEEKDLVT